MSQTDLSGKRVTSQTSVRLARQLLVTGHEAQVLDILQGTDEATCPDGLALMVQAKRAVGDVDGALKDAAHLAEQANSADCWALLAVTATRAGHWDQAREAVETAWTVRQDEQATGHADVGRWSDPEVIPPVPTTSLLRLRAAIAGHRKDHQDACDTARQWHAADPQSPDAAIALAGGLLRIGMVWDAWCLCSRLCADHEDNARAWNVMGCVAQDLGLMDQAMAAHRNAFALDPQPSYGSNLLYGKMFLPGCDTLVLDQEHQALCNRIWGEALARPPLHSRRTVWDGVRPLRVGYISPDFKRHSVAFFLLPLLENHDPRAVEVFCYASLAHEDDMTARLRASAAHWRDIHSLSDDQAASVIAQDDLDVLIDLAGHTASSRIGVLARRPAPCQLTWLGYPGITGLSAVNGRICDAVTDPVELGNQACSGERPYRLTTGFHCWRPPQDCPDPPPLPAGPPVVGCFGTLTKINGAVLDVWADLLHQVPDARLLLKAKPLCQDAAADRLAQALDHRGIDPKRLITLGSVPGLSDHLALYGRLHMALDTFPYTGTTTVCEALWMGIPVVTLRGSSRQGRVAESLLRCLGSDVAETLVAETPAEYVRIVVELLGDPARLTRLRSSLRPNMAAGPLRDEVGFARHFEGVLARAVRRAQGEARA